MTDRERKKRRIEMEQRMRMRQKGKKQESGGKSLFLFRAYVTMILAGAFLVISFFQTDTSEMVSERLKETIAYQIPAGDMVSIKNAWVAFLQAKEIPLPVFQEKEEESEKTESDKPRYKPDLESSP